MEVEEQQRKASCSGSGLSSALGWGRLPRLCQQPAQPQSDVADLSARQLSAPVLVEASNGGAIWHGRVVPALPSPLGHVAASDASSGAPGSLRQRAASCTPASLYTPTNGGGGADETNQSCPGAAACGAGSRASVSGRLAHTQNTTGKQVPLGVRVYRFHHPQPRGCSVPVASSRPGAGAALASAPAQAPAAVACARQQPAAAASNSPCLGGQATPRPSLVRAASTELMLPVAPSGRSQGDVIIDGKHIQVGLGLEMACVCAGVIGTFACAFVHARVCACCRKQAKCAPGRLRKCV